MLTLVAAVLAYDMAREICDALSSAVEAADMTVLLARPMPGDGLCGCCAWRGLRFGAGPSRRARSWTRLEKDMVAFSPLYGRGGTRG